MLIDAKKPGATDSPGKRRLIGWVPLFCVALAQFILLRPASAQSLYIEAETAQFAGDWFSEPRTDGAFDGVCLRSNNSGGTNDAALVLTITNAGTYNVWVRTRDFDTFVGQRQFQVGIDGVLFPFIAGAHGTNGWLWENVGARALAAQAHVLTLRDISHFFPRCDALFLTTTTTNPNLRTFAQLATSEVTLRPVPFRNLDSPNGFMLRFTTSADATNNFRALVNGPLLAQTNVDGGLLRFTAGSNNCLASAVFDTVPGDGAATNNLFTSVTVSADVRFGTAQQSFGFFTRVPGAENDGHLVLVNCDASGSTDMFRIFGAGSHPKSNVISSTILLQDSTNVLATGTWYTLRLTVKNTGNGGATFTLDTINRTNGSLVITKSATAVAGALTAAGEIGLRCFSTLGGAGEMIDVDNFSVIENVPEIYTNGVRTVVGTLNGSGSRVTFYSQPDIDGGLQIARETAVLISNVWVTVPFTPGAERLFLQYRSAVTPDTEVDYVTTWSQRVDFDVNGALYTTSGTTEDPLLAANPEVLIPRSAVQTDSQTIQITCRSLAGRVVIATWQLGAGGNDLGVTVNVTADRTGNYSLGFGSYASSTKGETTFHVLPPFDLFQRLPATPKLFPSSGTPQPLALVQRNFPGVSQPVTFGVVADPARFAFEWPSTRNSEFGFSLLNTDGTVQPAVFSPVLGLKGSLVNTGATLTASWRVLARAGDWKSALEYASANVLGVTDYRQPYQSSLTHSLLNMIDVTRDDVASGWGGDMRAPFQIESENTVTHPSPLTFLSLAMLTEDESLYQTRSLPTIEYGLSRPRAHFATEVTVNTPSGYVTPSSTVITIPSTFDGTAYWQGVDELLGHRNPWVANLALTNGNVRFDASNPYLPRWLEKLGQYRLSPSPALLQQIESDCATWLNTEFVTAKTTETSVNSFYHYGFYPFWWGLLDLYEITGNITYLNYAEEGGFHTIAGVFSHPMPPAGNITVHPTGSYQTNFTIWWKGPVRYRLGWPRTAGDTPAHSVPAWLVSPVGFTIEQPSTYYTNDGEDSSFNMQMMAAWAAQLMRLHRHTGREIYQTYARNALIGRFSTEPGYYVRGFTDMFHDPQYPFLGPDVSSFYYHHAPARMAFVIDFLMAQAETLSAGRVDFPWVKQQGYVWFTDRIFGGQPGALYGETGLWPWFDRNAAQVDTEKVDYFFARGSNSFWVVMMNQSPAPVTVHLTTAAASLGIIPNQPVQVFENDQARPATSHSSPLSVVVPGRKLVALRFATQSRDIFPRLVPLTATPTNRAVAGAWGAMQAFRTRSPFGADSLYVVMTGRPSNAPIARLLLDGAPVATDTTYPFEFSVYPWAMNQPMRFSVQLVDGGVTNNSVIVSLPGTTNLPPTAYEDWKTGHGLAANAPDAGDNDGDGWRNLLEYALNLNPQVADAPPAPAYSSDGTRLTLTYVKWRSDVTYFVETSLDLATWTQAGITEIENGGSVIASVPIDATQSRFLRLGVSR